MVSLRVDVARCRYQALIGVGGIGSGKFFALTGNHTLGREESRGGHFLGRRDYCKLHIVCHYVKVLLGPEFTVLPIGKVGDDDVGREIYGEMAEASLDMRHVSQSAGNQTLFSLCLVYPDGTGGNLTTDDSACAGVNGAYVEQAEPEFMRFEGRGMAVALPEVPLEARLRLLRLGASYRLLRVASFTSAEMRQVVSESLLDCVDLLAINLDEATAATDVSLAGRSLEAVAEAAIGRLHQASPSMRICVTAGSNGSWCWNGERLHHVPAYPTEVVSTAGAGDAYLAGVLVGLSANLALFQAQELGALVAAHSTTSPHTIDKRIDRVSLKAFAARSRAPICDAVRELLAS